MEQRSVYEIVDRRTGRRFPCAADCSVLRAMIAAGCGMIPVGCRGGGCGVCRVRIVGGDHHLGPCSRAQLSEADIAAGWALACRLYPRGVLTIECGSADMDFGGKVEWP